MLTSIFQSTKDASIELALLDGDTINSILLSVAKRAVE